MRHLAVAVMLWFAQPAHGTPLLLVDAVPDASAPWLVEAPQRYTAWLEAHQVAAFLQLVAPVFATQLDASRPLRIHLVAVHGGESMRARTLADDLAVQIREEDTPDRRADVIVHEAVHALQQRSNILQRIHGLPEPAQQLLDEALATAIGQGLWRWLDHALEEAMGEAAWRRGRDRYPEDSARPWYVANRTGAQIDVWARALQACVTQAIAYGTPIDAAQGALQESWRLADLAVAEQGR